jgi:hypothetical protein
MFGGLLLLAVARMIHHSLSLWLDEDRPLTPVARTRRGDLTVTGSGRTTTNLGGSLLKQLS